MRGFRRFEFLDRIAVAAIDARFVGNQSAAWPLDVQRWKLHPPARDEYPAMRRFRLCRLVVVIARPAEDSSPASHIDGGRKRLMQRFVKRIRYMISLMCLYLMATTAAAASSDTSWPAIGIEQKPWTRWWWLGSAVDRS